MKFKGLAVLATTSAVSTFTGWIYATMRAIWDKPEGADDPWFGMSIFLAFLVGIFGIIAWILWWWVAELRDR